VRLTAAEKASDSCEKAPARWLSAGRRISLGKLFLQSADSSLSVGHSLLHHEKALDQHVRSRRNLSDLAPDQLISFGIFALAAGLVEPIEQTGYEITFFGCHSLRKTLFSTLTSLEAVSVPGQLPAGAGETCWSVGVLERWSVGVLECWSVGVLECWSVGALECVPQSSPLSVSAGVRMKRERSGKKEKNADPPTRRSADPFPLPSLEAVFARADE
jgi:hypothetical protein